MVKRNLKARGKITSLRAFVRKSSVTKTSKKASIKSSREKVSSKTKVWNDVHHENRFWVNDGNVLKNLQELPGALRNMDAETFMHHVNDEKNDFANWVNDVVGEKTLARDLLALKSKTPMVKAIKARL
jgi:hypothetical protein